MQRNTFNIRKTYAGFSTKNKYDAPEDGCMFMNMNTNYTSTSTPTNCLWAGATRVATYVG